MTVTSFPYERTSIALPAKTGPEGFSFREPFCIRLWLIGKSDLRERPARVGKFAIEEGGAAPMKEVYVRKF